MHSFLAYILIADSLMAILFMLAFWIDKERKIDESCFRAGIDVTVLTLLGVSLGFIILPVLLMDRIAKKANGEK